MPHQLLVLGHDTLKLPLRDSRGRGLLALVLFQQVLQPIDLLQSPARRGMLVRWTQRPASVPWTVTHIPTHLFSRTSRDLLSLTAARWLFSTSSASRLTR